MRGDGRSHRRRFLAGLAATGSAALAGCGFLSMSDDTGPTFTAADAAGIVTDAPPEIEWPVPVVPTSDALEAELERVDTLLADVPGPIEADTVPNGAVRQSIGDRRDEARDAHEEAAAATGDDRYRALRTTREARDAARAATTALDAVGAETEPIVADLREERETVRSDVYARIRSISYRGAAGDDELLRAALFYARQESDLRRAADRLDHWAAEDGATVIDIGDGAGDVEFAAATKTVWDHFENRFVERVGESADLTSTFDAALEASAERVGSVDVPDRSGEDWPDGVVDGGLDDQRLEQVLWRAVDPVWGPKNALGPQWEPNTVRNGDTAIGLHEAVRFEARYRAFEDVRDRIVDGTLAAPESVDEIRAERTAALEAATSATGFLTRPSIGTHVLAETLRSLETTDESVRRAADNDPEVAVSLIDEYSDYARLRAQLEALPDAVETFRERLRSA